MNLGETALNGSSMLAPTSKTPCALTFALILHRGSETPQEVISMNVKYVAKNPTPSTQTITLRQGLPLAIQAYCSTEAVTVQVPPMSVREILFNENGCLLSKDVCKI